MGLSGTWGLSGTCNFLPCMGYRLRIEPVVGREGQKQGLIRCEIVEHRSQETWLAGAFADRVRAEPGDAEETLQPFIVRGEEAESAEGYLLGIGRR